MKNRTIRGLFASAMMMGMTWAAVEHPKELALQNADADCESKSLTENDVKLCRQVDKVIFNSAALAAVAAAGATAFMLAGYRRRPVSKP